MAPREAWPPRCLGRQRSHERLLATPVVQERPDVGKCASDSAAPERQHSTPLLTRQPLALPTPQFPKSGSQRGRIWHSRRQRWRVSQPWPPVASGCCRFDGPCHRSTPRAAPGEAGRCGVEQVVPRVSCPLNEHAGVPCNLAHYATHDKSPMTSAACRRDGPMADGPCPVHRVGQRDAGRSTPDRPSIKCYIEAGSCVTEKGRRAPLLCQQKYLCLRLIMQAIY